MARTSGSGRWFAAGLIALLVSPASAQAQWYLATGLGGNYTHNADVVIDQPALDTSLRFASVPFDARPLTSPQYYVLRVGRMLGAERRFGLEFEFIHLKVIAQTDREVHITGQRGGATVDVTAPMNTEVQAYNMTHGLNFFLVNFVSRTPMGDSPVALMLRAGAGPTRPGADSRVGGRIEDQYEYAGMGVHGAAGVDIRIHRRLSAMVEYKLTFARPTITVADGTGQTTTVSHQVAVGFAIGLSR